ncbi:myeloid-derived growth factor-like isoform X1 [Branchiostoma lanceolatum]|uniref:myeloid-derived growth factor-like isoform X1 n=1 Tax=Branchiostoma lanceolatum TaxID=7740 RepID=UPI003451DC93
MARFFTFCVLLSFMICLTVSKSAKKNKDPEFEAFKQENKKPKWSHVEEGLHAEAFDLIASGETLTFERKLDKHFSCSFSYAAKPINVTEEEWRVSLTVSPDGSAYSCHVFCNNERQGLTSEVAFQKFHLKIKGDATRYGYTEVYRDPDNKLAEEEYSVDEDNMEVTQVDGKFGNRLSAVVIVAGMPLNHEEL